MTQTFSSSSSAGDAREPDNQSSSEIRADIDQTRASVGEKIDQLQARLDPNRLKVQAQETVQEMLNDTASSMTEYVRSHKDQMVTSLADSARRNPLPTALVGLGLGWLILESMAGDMPQQPSRWQERSQPGRRDDRSFRGFEGSSGRSYVSQGRGQYMEEDYPVDYEESADWGRSSYPAGYEGQSSTQRSGASSSGSLSSGPSSFGSSTGGSSTGSSGREYNQQYNNQQYNREYGQESNRQYAQGSQQGSREEYGNGHQSGNPIAKATNAVKDSMGGVTERLSGAVEDIKDRLSGTVGDVTDRLSGTVGDVKDQMSGTLEDVRGRVGGSMQDMRQQAAEMSRQGQRSYNRAGQQMDEWQRQARYQGQQRGQQVINNLEDNPLIYGAVALAAGAALALLLPQTRVENRAFGEMRDQVMTKGQDVFDTAREHAQQVVEEIRPELEEKARQIVSDVTETGKQAVRDAADELKPVVDKAVSRTKDEARNVVQEAGVNPDQLTGQSSGGQSMSGQTSSGQSMSGQSSGGQSTSGQSAKSPSANATNTGTASMGAGASTSTAKAGSQAKPVLNRDTLAGQWKQVQGEVKKKWGQLTDDDMMQIEGNYDKLVGSIQTRYGYNRERIEREVNDFFESQKS